MDIDFVICEECGNDEATWLGLCQDCLETVYPPPTFRRGKGMTFIVLNVGEIHIAGERQ